MPCLNLFPPYGDNPCGGHAWMSRTTKNCWVFNFDYHLDHSDGDRREICRALKPRRYKLDEY